MGGFALRFEEALERYRKRRLTAEEAGEEAGELLGMSGRYFRRLLVRQCAMRKTGPRDCATGGSAKFRRGGRPQPS
jgi:hypothetical protein